jgi:hypothetical protein
LAGVLRDAVGELVPDHVQAVGEVGEQGAVAVAEPHVAFAVPEGVVVVGVEMHHPVDRHALVVDGIAVEDLPVEL